MNDLSIIVTSLSEARWLGPCLSSVYDHAGDIDLDIIVVYISSEDEPRDLVQKKFPEARLVACENRGYALANNTGLHAADARYVLFLNPDTEVKAGTFADLVATMDARPDVGMIGCRQ